MNARIAKKTLVGTRIGLTGHGWSAWQVAHKLQAARIIAARPKWHPGHEWKRDRPMWLMDLRRSQATKKNPYPLCSNCLHGSGPRCHVREGRPPCPAFPPRPSHGPSITFGPWEPPSNPRQRDGRGVRTKGTPLSVLFRCVASTEPGDVGVTFTADMCLDPRTGNVRRRAHDLPE